MVYKKKRLALKVKQNKKNTKLWSSSTHWLVSEFILATEGRSDQLFKNSNKKTYKNRLTLLLLKKNNINVIKKRKVSPVLTFFSLLYGSWTFALKARQLLPPLLKSYKQQKQVNKHTDLKYRVNKKKKKIGKQLDKFERTVWQR